MKTLIRLGFLPLFPNLALLILRVSFGITLFLKYGLDKISKYSTYAAQFPDPLHIGAHWSLAFAIFVDAICPLFWVIGLATRWAALLVIINTSVALLLVHHLHLFGEHNGESALLFLSVALAIFLCGAGSISFDHVLGATNSIGKPSRRFNR